MNGSIKKFSIITLVITISFLLLGCKRDIEEEKYLPVLIGGESLTLMRGDIFNPLDGLVANDGNGNDLLSSVEIDGLESLQLTNDFHTTKTGDFVLRYHVTNHHGYVAQHYRVISVIPLTASNLVFNGDFSLGLAGWDKPSTTSLETDAVHFANGDTLEQHGILFEYNTDYIVRFDADSDSEATVSIDLIDHDLNLKQGFNTTFVLNSEKDTYQFVFRMLEKTTTNATLKISVQGLDARLYEIQIESTKVSEDLMAPEIIGAEHVTVVSGASFNVRSGVFAIDDVDGNITFDIEIIPPAGVDIVNDQVLFTIVGSYIFIYRVSDREGNETIVQRLITVEGGLPSLVEMIRNQSFENELMDWDFSNNEGSSSTYEVIDGELIIDISSLPSPTSSPFPRLMQGKQPGNQQTEGIVFEQGAIYNLTFYAKSDEPHKLLVQIGELLDGNPWIISFTEDQVFDLSTEYHQFEIEFMMTRQTNMDGMIAFGMGNFNQTGQTTTTIYIKDISLIKQ